MRPKLPPDDVGVDQTTGLHVFLGLEQGPVQSRAGVLVEPVPRVEREELDLCAFGELCWLVHLADNATPCVPRRRFPASVTRRGFAERPRDGNVKLHISVLD